MSTPRPLMRAALLSAALGACDLPSENPTLRQPIEEIVTGAAQAALTDDGTFRLVASKAPPGLEIISPQRARELAQYEARTFGPMQPSL